jgi:hypothetical protein
MPALMAGTIEAGHTIDQVNVVLFDWRSSPIVYAGQDPLRIGYGHVGGDTLPLLIELIVR